MYYIIEIPKAETIKPLLGGMPPQRVFSRKHHSLLYSIHLLDDVLINRDYYDFYINKYSVSNYLHDYCQNMTTLQLNMLLSYDEFWEDL